MASNLRLGASTDDLGKSSRGNHRVIHFSDAALNEVGNRWKNAGVTSGTAIESKVVFSYDAVLKQSNGSYQLTSPTGFDKYFWVINDNGIYNHLNSDVTSRVFTSPVPSSNFTAVTCYMGKSTGQTVGDDTNGWNLVFEMTHPFILSGFQGQKALSTSPPAAVGASATQVSFNVLASNVVWEATENSNWFSITGVTGGDGTTQITLDVDANIGNQRKECVTITEDGGGLSQTIEITQNGSGGCTQTNLFKAAVGRDVGVNNCGNCGSGQTIVFKVYNHTTGALIGNGVSKTINQSATDIVVPIAGVSAVRLVVEDGGDQNWGDHANWGDARWTCAGSNFRETAEEEEWFWVSPNPNSGKFIAKINLKIPQSVQLYLSDARGNIFKEYTFVGVAGTNDLEIDIEDKIMLEAIYNIKCQAGEATSTKRVVVEK